MHSTLLCILFRSDCCAIWPHIAFYSFMHFVLQYNVSELNSNHMYNEHKHDKYYCMTKWCLADAIHNFNFKWVVIIRNW